MKLVRSALHFSFSIFVVVSSKMLSLLGETGQTEHPTVQLGT